MANSDRNKALAPPVIKYKGNADKRIQNVVNAQ